MYTIVPKSVLFVGSVIVLSVVCQKLNITSCIRHQGLPNLKDAFDTIDALSVKGRSAELLAIHNHLNELLVKVKNLTLSLQNVRGTLCPALRKSINTVDAAERESLIKIIGIPGLSRYYYIEVLHQLARQLQIPFHETDVIMLKRMNSQPNLVHSPEISLSNLSYPLFVKFAHKASKESFLRCWSTKLKEMGDEEYLNKIFQTKLTFDTLESTADKLQIHGFKSMGVPTMYRTMDRLTQLIGFHKWKSNIATLYQSRYTKHLDPAGTEQLQTEGIIIKMRSRALKAQWMRKTRLVMLSRPKAERKSGFVIHLENHLKYKHRTFTAYIDEHLSTHKKNLFLVARGRCNIRGWTHCWTWDSTVFVRKNTSAPPHRIDTFEDINRIIV